MSQTTLPDATTAYNNLFEGVHQEVFFHKCAAAGLAPRTQEEAAQMLELAGNLRAVKEAQAIKQAQDGPVANANRLLRQMMNQSGIPATKTAAAQDDADAACWQYAAALTQDATLYNSALVLKAAEAQELAQTQA